MPVLKRETEFPLFDTHAHYNDHRFDAGEGAETDGRDAVLTALLADNVRHIVNVGTNLSTNAESIALAEKYPQIYAAAGIHPEDINPSDDMETVMNALKEQLAHPKVVALGEIGLDYHWDEPSREIQKAWLRRQLRLACETGKPVIIHDREAHGDIMDILRDYPDVTGVFHSFSASAEIARQFVLRGWYISFSGVITFKNAARLAEIVPTVPLDRVLIETDCPYLAPVPFRGKINHSGLMERTALRAAELYGVAPDEFCRTAYDNAMRFYGISD